MTTRYAEGTTVSAEKSQMEIQQMLKRYGATDVASGEQGDNQAIIGFRFARRAYKIILTYPEVSGFRLTDSGKPRNASQAKEAREREVRRLWRVMLMVIRGKLEAAQSDVVSFEQEFMAHIVVNPEGQTFYEWAKPQLDSNSLYLPPPTKEGEGS